MPAWPGGSRRRSFRRLGQQTAAAAHSHMTDAMPSPLPPPSEDLSTAILGLWQLLTREDYDREGRRHIDPVMGPDPLGALSFSPGHFAAQFMSRDRSVPAPTAATAGANNSGAVDGYDAYFGSYSLDRARGTITVQLEGALSPANIGQCFTRDIRVEDNRLTIRLATTAADGTPVTRTLTFRRAG
jgi:Lipocalin-like domain